MRYGTGLLCALALCGMPVASAHADTTQPERPLIATDASKTSSGSGSFSRSRGQGFLQCVRYASIVSGINLDGDAFQWWEQAQGQYARGKTPRPGAVMAFSRSGSMRYGHVAVVSKILNSREILIRHANWSLPGAIEEDVLARDVSKRGDWSAVAIWYTPVGQMGTHISRVQGFIYTPNAELHPFEPERDAGEMKWTRLSPKAPDQFSMVSSNQASTGPDNLMVIGWP